MELPCDGFVLLVGDGDFSFTLSLMKKGSLKGSQVTTSNLETLESIQQHRLAAENMKVLTEIGVQVFLETDARELHTHPAISQIRYQRVIFNFPLADRHNIKLNRALLADFFSSCSQILSHDGQVMVTLCKGQGGTPADQPMRSWHDSWQAHAMATNAGFILSQVLPFDALDYPQYHSVGFRFQDKSFHTDGALVHIFEKADMTVTGDGVSARGVVHSDGGIYTSTRYVAEKLSRDLLDEPNHPLSLLRQRLEKSLSLHVDAERIPHRDSLCILRGHKSSISTCTRPSDRTSQGHENQDLHDSLKTVKDRKNEANLTILMNAKTASLAHGVDRQNDLRTSPGPPSQDISQIIPDNPESVFILTKRSPSTEAPSCNKEHDQTVAECTAYSNQDVAEECRGSSPAPGGDTSSSLDVYGVQIEGSGSHVKECIHRLPSGVECEQTINHLDVCCTDGVYHCRASLLENFTELCLHVYSSNCSEVCPQNLSTSFSSGLVSGTMDVGSTDSLTGQCQLNTVESYISGKSGTTSKGDQCFVVSGKCFLPGPITPNTLAVRHEMMIVQKIAHRDTDVQRTPQSNLASTDTSLATANQQIEPQDIERLHHAGHSQDLMSVLPRVLSCLLQSGSSSQISLSIEDIGSAANITFSGIENITDMKMIYLEPERNTGVLSQQQLPPPHCRQVLAGLVFQVEISGDNMMVVVLELDNIVCTICNIDDPRVLWSRSTRFTDQFQPAISFPQRYQPFSLYPMKFTHDLSFWQKDSDSEFDVFEMYNIILYIAGDLVYSVSLRDIYTDPDTGQVSRCYRLQFVSHDQALPYLVSWKLQGMIRIEVAHKLGITLR